MTHAFRTVLILAACLVLACSCNTYLSTKPEEFASADLFGMIYDHHNQACPGVRVSIDGAAGPLSDVNGRFTLPNISRGRHAISVKKESFEEASFDIEYLSRTQVVYLKIISFSQILELAENALTERKLAEAGSFLARAEKIDDDNPLLLYLKAVLELKRGRPTDALALLLSIIEHQTAEPHVYLTLADIYEYDLKDSPKAVSYLKKFAQAVQNDEVQARIKRLEGKK